MLSPCYNFFMLKAPTFFLPAANAPEQAESVYAELDAICPSAVPPMARRIYSITWNHNGEEWIAIVGEQLKSTRRRTVGSDRNKREVDTPTSDLATVLAIFQEIPISF